MEELIYGEIKAVRLEILQLKKGADGKLAATEPAEIITTPYAVIVYEKDGMDMIQTPGVSMTKADGIIHHFLEQANKFKRADAMAFDELLINIFIIFSAKPEPEVIPVQCQRAIIFYYKDEKVNNDFVMYGMDVFTAYGTMDFVKTQLAIGGTFQSMAKKQNTGLQVPRAGAPLPQINRNDPRFRG